MQTYRTQIELAERERQLTLFFEKSPLGVIQWDDEFTIVRLNEAAEEILGYTESELAGESWEILIPRDTRDEIQDRIITPLLEDDGGFHRVNENLRKDGHRITCEWHNWTVTNDDGEVSAIFAQFEEVSDETAR